VCLKHGKKFKEKGEKRLLCFLRLDDMSVAGYMPTDMDVLRARVRTLGIVESSFTIDGNGCCCVVCFY